MKCPICPGVLRHLFRGKIRFFFLPLLFYIILERKNSTIKKRILSIFMILSMVLSLFPLQVFSAEVTGLKGTGSVADPYLISTPEELVFAAQRMNASDAAYTGKSYKLTADIDLNSVASFPTIASFTGTFSGDGHTIYNMPITDTVGTVPSNGYGIGFVHKNSGLICDLTFEGAKISTVANAAGNGNSGASVVASENCQNGIISSVAVKNCEVNAPLVPKAAAISSMNSRSSTTSGANLATIRNCSVVDTVLTGGPRSAGNSYGLMMGAIVGYNGASTIENCYVSNVTLQAASESTCPFYAGMICGYGAGGVVNGNVVVSGSVLRLAAEADQQFTKVNTGGICATNNSYYGSLAYPNGNLLCRANVVGDAGSHTLSGTDTTAETLKLQATYEALGWDMYSAWKMVDGVPVLRAPSERNPLLL